MLYFTKQISVFCVNFQHFPYFQNTVSVSSLHATLMINNKSQTHFNFEMV